MSLRGDQVTLNWTTNTQTFCVKAEGCMRFKLIYLYQYLLKVEWAKTLFSLLASHLSLAPVEFSKKLWSKTLLSWIQLIGFIFFNWSRSLYSEVTFNFPYSYISLRKVSQFPSQLRYVALQVPWPIFLCQTFQILSYLIHYFRNTFSLSSL